MLPDKTSSSVNQECQRKKKKKNPFHHYLPFEMTFPSTKYSTSYICLAIHFLEVPSLGKHNETSQRGAPWTTSPERAILHPGLNLPLLGLQKGLICKSLLRNYYKLKDISGQTVETGISLLLNVLRPITASPLHVDIRNNFQLY